MIQQFCWEAGIRHRGFRSHVTRLHPRLFFHRPDIYLHILLIPPLDGTLEINALLPDRVTDVRIQLAFQEVKGSKHRMRIFPVGTA